MNDKERMKTATKLLEKDWENLSRRITSLSEKCGDIRENLRDLYTKLFFISLKNEKKVVKVPTPSIHRGIALQVSDETHEYFIKIAPKRFLNVEKGRYYLRHENGVLLIESKTGHHKRLVKRLTGAKV